ncbi:MAG: ATP-dependent DNA helicase [Ignavibacteria bacterium]|nr:ATP-dependent DNA helicase [Ignavibacteria bacterium]
MSSIKGYEYRKEQTEMACLVAESLEKNEHLIIEAPTGIGKSFAYLVPSIVFAKMNDRKAIVSTCTINLQEQLIAKDLPALEKVLPFEFRYEIIKGRRNYICSKRLSRAMASQESLFENEEQTQLREIYNFTQRTGKGTKQDINFRINENIWSEIFAEDGICTHKSCGSADTNCWYQLAKRNMQNADVLVVNHYLFFTLFGFSSTGDSKGYLYLDDFVIFDEAHTVENIAAQNISPQVTKEQIHFWLNKLYNPRKRKGFFAEKPGAARIRTLVEQIQKENEAFFLQLNSELINNYPQSKNKQRVRIKTPLSFKQDFTDILLDLAEEIRKITATAIGESEENEMRNYYNKFTAIRSNIITFLNQEFEKHVYWIEYSQNRSNISLCLSPLDMAEYFRNNIFTEKKLSIMTSATLSVNKSLEYFKKTIGADNISGKILPSPFNLKEQMKLHLFPKIPEQELKKEKLSDLLKESEYEKVLSEKIFECVQKTSGGSLVLFTNANLLRKMYDRLLEKFLELNIILYAQNNGMPNNIILDKFRADENSVLFGVDSFWMGVDIPGNSLRNVIITKLPFEVPDDPLTEAKMEMISERGGNTFYEYSLPVAVLKFRQGVGRLIRNKSDKGIICILDSRIVNKAYGRFFLDSLPECDTIIEN